MSFIYPFNQGKLARKMRRDNKGKFLQVNKAVNEYLMEYYNSAVDIFPCSYVQMYAFVDRASRPGGGVDPSP